MRLWLYHFDALREIETVIRELLVIYPTQYIIPDPIILQLQHMFFFSK